MDSYIRATSQFVSAADQAFNTLLHGDYSLTQAEMNAVAADNTSKAKESLAAILAAVDPHDENAELKASQAAWESFCDRHAEFCSGINRPATGSMAPLLYSSEVEKMTRSRIEQLELYLRSNADGI